MSLFSSCTLFTCTKFLICMLYQKKVVPFLASLQSKREDQRPTRTESTFYCIEMAAASERRSHYLNPLRFAASCLSMKKYIVE